MDTNKGQDDELVQIRENSWQKSSLSAGQKCVYGVTSWVRKVLCSLGSHLFCMGPCGVWISNVPSSLKM
jgi:hypothetical protein